MAITEKDIEAQAKDMARRISEAERGRPAGLAFAAGITDARLAALQMERQRLAHKYGPEHARVQGVAARISAVASAQQEFAAEIQRSTIRGPRPSPQAAAMHGRVIDQNHAGLPGLTVRARLAEEATEIAKAGTDDTGHFVLMVRQQKPEDTAVSVILEVLAGNNRVMYRETDPRELRFGSVAYVEIEPGERSPRTTASPSTEPPPAPDAAPPSAPPRPRAARAQKKKR